jgi:pyruvate formate lyase activating enzyme
MDGEKHRAYTGRDNSLILSNARFLAESGASVLFRQPLIPGVNDTEENIRATAAFIRSLGREDLGLQLIAYHRMGAAKYAALDLPYLMGDLPAMLPEKADAVRAKYEALGVSCTVSR